MHPWVNFQSMLEKCLIGTLVGKPVKMSTSSSDSLSVSSKDPDNSGLRKTVSLAEPEPVIDSYQSLDKVNIVIYTKWKNMHSDYLIIEKISSEKNPDIFSFVLFVYIKDQVYKYATGKEIISLFLNLQT